MAEINICKKLAASVKNGFSKFNIVSDQVHSGGLIDEANSFLSPQNCFQNARKINTFQEQFNFLRVNSGLNGIIGRGYRWHVRNSNVNSNGVASQISRVTASLKNSPKFL
ncbi:MAG: hypothetical protein M3388_00105 [Acidobacteriota bacterium]|nr:hypothetical protein [Acidobacteriota bacterium]